MPPKVCKFYNTPQGCRRGGKCDFLHPNALDQSQSANANLSPASTGSTGPRPQRPPPPPAVCRFWAGTRNCRAGKSCRFAHPDPAETRVTPVEVVAPFLTDAGLAKVSGAGTDIFYDMDVMHTPAEVFFRLHKMLRVDFKFLSSANAVSFLTCLSSANTSNTPWVRS